MISAEHFNILGSLIDNTFGKSSIRDAGYGVKVSLAGSSDSSGEMRPVMELRFETIVNFNPRHGMTDQRKELDKTSSKMILEKLEEIKREFKELAGKSLKCKELLAPDATVIHISHNPSLVRARYCRPMRFEFHV